MSIEAAASNTISGLQTFETKQKIAYQLAAKQLDIVREQGDLILELIDSANIQGKVPGAGSRFDAVG